MNTNGQQQKSLWSNSKLDADATADVLTQQFRSKIFSNLIVTFDFIWHFFQFFRDIKVVHLYSAFSIWRCSKALYNDQFTPSGPGSIYTKRSMYAGTHFTDPGRMESWVNFSGKEGHSNIQPSTRPGIEPGTSGLGGRDLFCILFFFHENLTKISQHE